MSTTSGHRFFAPVPPPREWSPSGVATAFRTGVHRMGIPTDPTPLGPVWGTHEAAAAVRKVALLLPLLQRTLRTAGLDRATLITALRTDPSLYPFEEGLSEDPDQALVFARPDVAVSPSGPKVLEFNTGPGIGGYIEQHVMQNVWHEVYGPVICEPDPLRQWAQVLSTVRTRNGTKPSQVVVLTTRRDFPDDVLDFDAFFGLQVRHLADLGVECLHLEPEELDARLPSLSPDACVGVRFFNTFEWRAHRIDFAPLQRALDRGFRFYFPQEAAMIANKRLLAWLSARKCHLTPGEARLVDELVPWTRELLAGVTDADRVYRYTLGHKDHLVVKRCMSNRSQDVVVGSLVHAKQWRKTVEDAFVAGDSVVQEFVEHMPADVYMTVNGQIEKRRVHPVLSPFFINGEYFGCQARYLPGGEVKPSSVDLNGAVLNTVVMARQADHGT